MPKTRVKLHNDAVRRPLMLPVLIVWAAMLVGCAQAEVYSVSCSAAFDELPALEPQPGIYDLMSDKVAQTLMHCGSADEWKARLAERPEVVGETSIPKDGLEEVFDRACSFLADFGRQSPICEDPQ